MATEKSQQLNSAAKKQVHLRSNKTMAMHIGNNNTIKNSVIAGYMGIFIRLVDGNNQAEKTAMSLEVVR